jgi:hypothetical protein
VRADEVHLAPGVASVESLGASAFEDFFRAPGSAGFERAKFVSAREGFEEIRYPLPGTPRETGESARSRGRPMGAGTGFVILRRFTSSTLRERWRARFRQPRSTSFGEREWNIVCHLRAHGIGAPEPLAVGRGAGNVFAERSFVVLRELDNMLSLKQWANAELDASTRARIGRSLDQALERMWSSGAWLPHVSAENVLVAPPHLDTGADPDCVARAIYEMQSSTPINGASELLKWGDLPEVAFTEFRGARLKPHVTESQKRAIARSLNVELQALHFELDLDLR